MLNLFKKNVPKKEFIDNFFKDPNHRWIISNSKTKKAFEILLNELKKEHIVFFANNPTYFIPCEANLSCAIGKNKDSQLILVFPELITLLKSASFYHGIAILAHEMGHIFHQHTEKKTDTLEAQIEADEFALQLGFGEELQEVLLDYNHSLDCRVRISKLTSKLIGQKFNQ